MLATKIFPVPVIWKVVVDLEGGYCARCQICLARIFNFVVIGAWLGFLFTRSLFSISLETVFG